MRQLPFDRGRMPFAHFFQKIAHSGAKPMRRHLVFSKPGPTRCGFRILSIIGRSA